ncbi:hypothetical protein HGRIS_004244 [Hohenbuehelia grisea]|uniref:BRCT domain-containing protein n=1 Tax=Hohenbuehelia grisea TaxID=104357 RepID=A0ABR3IP69_9AGAR
MPVLIMHVLTYCLSAFAIHSLFQPLRFSSCESCSRCLDYGRCANSLLEQLRTEGASKPMLPHPSISSARGSTTHGPPSKPACYPRITDLDCARFWGTSKIVFRETWVQDSVKAGLKVPIWRYVVDGSCEGPAIRPASSVVSYFSNSGPLEPHTLPPSPSKKDSQQLVSEVLPGPRRKRPFDLLDESLGDVYMPPSKRPRLARDVGKTKESSAKRALLRKANKVSPEPSLFRFQYLHTSGAQKGLITKGAMQFAEVKPSLDDLKRFKRRIRPFSAPGLLSPASSPNPKAKIAHKSIVKFADPLVAFRHELQQEIERQGVGSTEAVVFPISRLVRHAPEVDATPFVVGKEYLGKTFRCQFVPTSQG